MKRLFILKVSPETGLTLVIGFLVVCLFVFIVGCFWPLIKPLIF